MAIDSDSMFDSDRRRAITALGVFLLAQMVGLFLRALPLLPLPVNYTYVLYGHTHVALSGWVLAMLYLTLPRLLPGGGRHRAYGLIARLNLIGVLGMLVAFPLQGYKAVSISFSTFVILLSYAFVWLLWREGRDQPPDPAWRCARWSMGFLLLSSLAPWSLGFLMVRYPGSDWIQLAVYFYLHFLYNGAFCFALLALLLRWRLPGLEQHAAPWLRLLAVACLPAYALSALWVNPPYWVWWLAWLAAGMQVLALAGLVPLLWRSWRGQTYASPWSRTLLGVSLLCLAARVMLQAVSALPFVALPLAANRHLIIGYLHLVFLGFVSCFLLAWLIERALLRPSAPALGLFLAGFAVSEAWLFGAGAWFWFYKAALPGLNAGLLLASVLMPLGTAWLLLRQKASVEASTLR